MAALGRAGFEPALGSLPALAPGLDAEFQQLQRHGNQLAAIGLRADVAAQRLSAAVVFLGAPAAAEAPTAASVPSG